MILVLMGVSGSGKTTVGSRLAQQLGASFHDADDLHPAANRRKMAAGVALSDGDRGPWLAAVHELVLELERHRRPGVIACSALKRSYRCALLAGTSKTRIVYLRVEPERLARRLRERRGHFFDPDLLPSQLETLEEPSGDTLTIDGNRDVDDVVQAIVAALERSSPREPSEEE